MAPVGTMTGASTSMVVAWLEERQGPRSVDALFARLDQHQGREVSRQRVASASEVEYTLHTAILEEVADLADADDETLRQIGRGGADNVEEVIPGAGMMLKVASPERLLNRARTLWSTYADFGDVEVLRMEEGHARLRIYGFPKHDHFCRTLEGLFEGLVERAGGTEAEVREVEHDEGRGCVFEGTWTDDSGFF